MSAEIVVGMRIKAKGPTGWIGTVVSIAGPPKGYRLKMMPRYADDQGETVWIDWHNNILANAGEPTAYGYPMSTVEKLEVVG